MSTNWREAEICQKIDLPIFWKNLVGADLDPLSDLQEADLTTYNYIKKFELVESEEELRSLCAHLMPLFVYNSLNGHEVELFPGGRRSCQVSGILWCLEG